MLINKSDFLTEELRQHWSDYFNERGVNHLFFSAKKEQEVIDSTPDEEAPEDKDGNKIFDKDFLKDLTEEDEEIKDSKPLSTTEIFSRDDLITKIKSIT